jgi:flagellar biosynthesis protein FlhB
MIEINLLPQELQLKTKSTHVDAKNFLYLIPCVLAVVLVWHICLGIAQVSLSAQLKSLNKKWQELEPKRKIWETASKQFNSSPQDVELMQQLIKERVLWAEKLNLLSEKLPAGIWYNEISVSNKVFLLRGSVVSLEKQEVLLINKFLNNLKEEQLFFKHFDNLESGQMQREEIGGYDVMNFTINGKMK